MQDYNRDEYYAAPTSSDERMWGMLAHLSALIGYLGVPFGNVLGPLVVWLIKKDTMPFVDFCGRQALNFHISLLIYAVPLFILGALVIIGSAGCLLPLVILGGMIFGALDIIFPILAGVKANNGEYYRYPFAIPLL